MARDMRSDPLALRPSEAARRSYASGLALPLSAEGATLGALCIYSEVVGAFDERAMKLLAQLADDLAFGIRTLRDRAERALITAQLVQADRLVATGTLAAGVAHEINNPLAYVISAQEFIQRELDEIAPGLPPGRLDEIREALAEAREGTGRVRYIVRDLKTFSRGDEERRDRLDLRRVVDSASAMAFNEIKYRARLVKEYGDAPQVLASEARLGQVVLNLLINAAQSIPEGRADENEIRITAGTDPSGWACLEIRDTGEGIPADARGRIFDAFFTTKPVGIGTGLGLSICRNIVVAHGGEITFESRVGQGTTFRVVLPPAPPSGRGEPPPQLPGVEDGPRGRILVIDDEASIGNAIRRTLAARHDVIALTSARRARDLISRGERFDVILCDVMMPDMSGMDLHAELSAIAPEQAERMILLTGGAFTSKAKAFLESVPNPSIEKPFDGATLDTVVRSMLLKHGQRGVSASSAAARAEAAAEPRAPSCG